MRYARPAVPMALAAVAAAQVPFERMRQGTVLVELEGRVQTADGRVGTARGHGSGFVIGDGRWIVTNWHVCCKPGIEVTKLVVWATPDQPWPATVRWSSKRKDIGILEVGRPTGRPPAPLSPRSLITEGRKVYAMGFPGSADDVPDADGRKVVKITEGIIGAAVKGHPSDDEQLNGTRLYQHSSPISPGNSGGPLFDECGRVVAINVASPKTAVLAPGPDGKTRVVAVPSSAGIYWAIQIDELVEQLAAMQIKAEVATSACTLPGAPSPTSSLMVYGQIGTAALALVAVVLAATRRGREAVKRVTTYRRAEPARPREPAAAALSSAPSKPLLRGVGGYYQGTVMEMAGDAWVLGRDPRAASLVFPPDTEGVSRRHCTIRWDAGRRRFVLEDNWSTNGTFLANGEKVAPGAQAELRPGDRFYLGRPENAFEVRIEE